MKKAMLLKTAIAVALAAPLLASAESQLTAGAGVASARLDFRVVIPRVLFLAVGTGNAALTGNTTVDQLEFNYTALPATVGNGVDSAPQGINVRVLGNNGQITLSAAGSNTGLVNTLTPADVIPWSEILASSTEPTNFNVPAVGGTAAPALTSGKVTARTATWNYSYSNSATPAPGDYDGRVTYTAAMP
jgi:hypothetical protein